MASMQSYKPADETCQQNPSLGQKVAQMIGLAPKPSHHGQPVGHGQTGNSYSYHQGMTHANRHGHDASGGMACHGKTEKKMKVKKSEHKKEKSLTKKKSKGRDGKSCSSDSSSDSD